MSSEAKGLIVKPPLHLQLKIESEETCGSNLSISSSSNTLGHKRKRRLDSDSHASERPDTKNARVVNTVNASACHSQAVLGSRKTSCPATRPPAANAEPQQSSSPAPELLGVLEKYLANLPSSRSSTPENVLSEEHDANIILSKQLLAPLAIEYEYPRSRFSARIARKTCPVFRYANVCDVNTLYERQILESLDDYDSDSASSLSESGESDVAGF